MSSYNKSRQKENKSCSKQTCWYKVWIWPSVARALSWPRRKNVLIANHALPLTEHCNRKSSLIRISSCLLTLTENLEKFIEPDIRTNRHEERIFGAYKLSNRSNSHSECQLTLSTLAAKRTLTRVIKRDLKIKNPSSSNLGCQLIPSMRATISSFKSAMKRDLRTINLLSLRKEFRWRLQESKNEWNFRQVMST